MTMDVARPSNARQKKIRRTALAAAGLATILVVVFGLSRLKPAAQAVERSSVLVDTVKRGALVREVRGLGILVPEDIRWIPATTEGRVERIVLRPGVTVKADSIVLVLSNPQLEQQHENAVLQVKAAEAQLVNMRAQLQNEFLAQKAAAANVGAEYAKAKMLSDMYETLVQSARVPAITARQAKVDAEQLAIRDDIAKQQLASYEASIQARLAVQQADVDQARAMVALTTRQRNELVVRAGLNGVLQVVPVEVGQQVAPGANIARVADPTRLKAEIRVAETEAQDLQIGQKASIDTRNGIVEGTVTRIDPSVQNGTRTVDVILAGDLPKGAVPDLTVDGTIELERLPNVLYVGRPASAQEQQTVALFRVATDGSATRVPVKFGRRSVNAIEILDGLREGDQVVLSDTSAWNASDRVQLQ
jgi:HlyD family secretion protein